MSINIGLSDSTCKQVSQELNKILNEYYELAATTQFYHWYIKGPQFCVLHKLFGKHYDDFSKTIDVIAERIRALDEEIAIDFTLLQKFNSSQRGFSKLKDVDMLKNLIKSHECAAKDLRKAASTIGGIGDPVTADLLVARLETHEEALWVLRSFLS